MFAQLYRTADSRLRRLSPRRCWSQVSLWCFAALFGKACATLTLPLPVPDPANPYIPVPPVSYSSVIAPYIGLRPAKPGDWQKQNQSVAPQGDAPAHQH
jgi:hypothetical protein